MNTGKLFVGAIVISAIVAGAGMYYLQVYAFFDEVAADAPEAQIRLTNVVTELPEPILVEDFEAISGTSSPLRFRACFTTPQSQAMLTETYLTIEEAVPIVGPGWFGCYDAVEIGEALERGDAIAFMGEKNVLDGIDRVVAVFPDGQAYAWHQLNEKYTE